MSTLPPTATQTAGEAMAHGTLSAEIPRRITIAVDVPERLTDGSISEVCNLMASRLRYRLYEQYELQAYERVQTRIGTCWGSMRVILPDRRAPIRSARVHRSRPTHR